MQDKLSTLSLPEARLARILRCTASDVLRWARLYEQATAETDAIGFGMRRVQAGQTLLHEGQRFENVYLVGGGSFRHVQTDLEGYEQVLGFATHGDMLGLDGLGRDRHASGAVALEGLQRGRAAVRRIAGAEPPHPGAGAAAARPRVPN
ncbi:MAG: cyclic nucleotide-binding domain-containing protein [Betaproteobacteria bacterium]|nr:cyclic nucleotide-binding domain-containing protein [Betaproteobacteria bacterium]